MTSDEAKTIPAPAQAGGEVGLAMLRKAAQEVVDRWETPTWKDAPATAEAIYRLRDALDATALTAAPPKDAPKAEGGG